MGTEIAQVIELSPMRHRDDVLAGEGLLPVLPALRDLLPGGGLYRGSVVTSEDWGLLPLALVAGAVADGAWCAVVGVPVIGMRAAAEAGVDPDRVLLVAEPGPRWPQVVASLLDGFDIVLLRPPDQPSAPLRRKLEAAARRYGSVLVVAGDWPGAQSRLLVADVEWTGIGAGHGRLRARRAQVSASGRGAGERPRSAWLWLPGPDGAVSRHRDRAVAAAHPAGLAAGWAACEQRMTRRQPGAGMPPRVLVLRCPDLLGGEAGPEYQQDQEGSAAARAFDPVVTIVEGFCPHVEVLRPGVCAIPARGPARYFGGEAKLAAGLDAALRRSGFSCQVGIADGVFAAGLAARTGPGGLVVPPGQTPEFLARFGVGVLGMPDLCELLPRLGIETLGQLAELPPAEAASRFGPAGKLACRLARGLDPRPLIPRPPPTDLSAAMEFDPPAEQSEPVVFAAKTLADQMHDRLASAGLTCVRVRVDVRCADGSQHGRLWRHDGLLSALAVADRVRWQLDGRESPGGITLLRLVPDQLARATGRQLALWGDAVVSDRVARAAVRVQAMLGHERVTRPVLAGGRRPAEQVLLVPFGDAGTPQRPADRPWPGQIPAPAPTTVYPAPRPASVTDSAGAAVSVSGRAGLSAAPAQLAVDGGPVSPVTAWAGPWPVTQRWWDPQQACRQARFQLVTGDGTAWLAVLQDGRWLIEARYD